MGIESRSEGLATDREGALRGKGMSPGPKVEGGEPVLREKGSWGGIERLWTRLKRGSCRPW